MHVFVQESLATELQQSVTFGGRPTSYILLMLDTKSNWRAVVYMYYDNVPLCPVLPDTIVPNDIHMLHVL